MNKISFPGVKRFRIFLVGNFSYEVFYDGSKHITLPPGIVMQIT